MKYVLLSLILFPTFLVATTITEVIKNVVYTNPSVFVKKEGLNVEVDKLKEANSKYFPSVDLSFSIGPEVTKTPSNNGEKASLTRREASVIITQNIFSGFKTTATVAQQKSQILLAQNNLQSSVENIALDTALAYIDVLKKRALYNIAKDNVLVHFKYLSKIKEKLDAGMAVNSDYVQTLSRYENAKSVEFLATQDYLTAVYSLKRLSPDINITSLEEPILGKLPAQTTKDLVQLAMQTNSDLLVSNANIKVAESTVKIAKSEYYPTIDFVFRAYDNKNVHGVGYKTQTNPNPISKDSGYSGLIVIKYNLFNGFASYARNEISKNTLLKRRMALKDTKLFIKTKIKVALTTYKVTKKRIKHIEKYVQASKKAVSDYLEEYDLGRRTIIDLLNIELEYNNARNLQINAKYDLIKSYYQLLSYTGYLLKDMDIAIE
ncbi:Agglutination protein [hydrothermal vent metagenome]|uniref:Agglutination protein n=1 Tax=hydrothermal vent metagenome TaxID=652676 RepID=A0A1W1D4R5_9ZZZZ